MSSLQWPDLDRPREKPKTNGFLETAQVAARVFDTEDGAKLLEHLKQKFKDVCIADPNISPQFAFFRDGQRDVVFYLEKLINTAKEHRE